MLWKKRANATNYTINSLLDFERYQVVTYIYLMKDGKLLLKHNPFVEDCTQDQIGKHLIQYFYSEKDIVSALKSHDLVYLVERLFVRVIVNPEATGASRYVLYGAGIC